MDKLLIICGPTATGKTSLAMRLAKHFNGELVSADSRQVYKGLDIGTGKDIPEGSKWSSKGFWQTPDGIKIWGYDLVSSKEKFSVAQYQDRVEKILKNIYQAEKLPILVGGTGLYIKAIINNIETASIPPNFVLRKKLEEKTSDELLKYLTKINPAKASSLNDSDRKNSRRLIRAIEIAISKKKLEKKPQNYNTLLIGLTAPQTLLYKNIENRVSQRIKSGILEEIKSLLDQKISWKDQSTNTIGYKEFREYFEDKGSFDIAIENWIRDEQKYLKRQIVWFKKQKNINWFDISDTKFLPKVENLVQKWYK